MLQLLTSNKDAVIFVIDASASMLKTNQSDGGDEAEIPFRSAVQCVSVVMTSKLLSENTSDLIGVIFMGTVNFKILFMLMYKQCV